LTKDLFLSDQSLVPLEIPDADISYMEAMPLPGQPAQLLLQLLRETPWRQEDIVVWGKRHAQPRLIAWYGDKGRRYTYSGIQLSPLPWSELLRQIKRSVEAVSNCEFNSVLLNYYRNERDSMGFHSDDEKELGPRPAIASVSLGDCRQFVLKHKSRGDLRPVRRDTAALEARDRKADAELWAPSKSHFPPHHEPFRAWRPAAGALRGAPRICPSAAGVDPRRA
jgi:alkylated DNA repair dioxygenase AlkB